MSTRPPIRQLVAEQIEPGHAVLGSGRPLHYTVLPDPRDGLPGHIRAASAIRRRGSRLIVVQDDVNALALLDPGGGIEPLLLPAGPGGRRTFEEASGTKRLKMDLEACVLLPDQRLIAFGSGSSPRREHVVVLSPESVARVLPAGALFAELRRWTDAMGVELNVEGAVLQGERLRLLQRGNGRHSGIRQDAGSAVLDLSLDDFLAWLQGTGATPAVTGIVRVDLGAKGGVPLGFTDATITADGRLAFLCCAEDSADVRSDGPVLGCCFGWLDEDRARMTDVVGSDGRPTRQKLEGIESRPGQPDVFDVVADMDRPEEPSWLYELRVSG